MVIGDGRLSLLSYGPFVGVGAGKGNGWLCPDEAPIPMTMRVIVDGNPWSSKATRGHPKIPPFKVDIM